MKRIFSLVLILISISINISVIAGDYILNIDDHLNISVWGHSELQSECIIGPDGMISFPLIGELRAEGRTTEELNKILTERLSEYVINPRLNIGLKSYKRTSVLVLGEVNKPGTYEINSDKRILDLITMAGGIKEAARLNNIRLNRAKESLLIDLESLLNGDMTQNYLLEDGDVLYIPTSTIELSIMGEVKNPGTYQLSEGMRLNELLAAAGGPGEMSDLKNGKLFRGNKELQFDLQAVIEGGEISQNYILEKGDVVFIPGGNYLVSILGEVNRPGTFKWHSELELAQLMALAGNQNERGDIENIRITHADGSTDIINFKEYLMKDERDKDFMLEAGDVVTVKELSTPDWQKIFFFISGLNSLKDFLDW